MMNHILKNHIKEHLQYLIENTSVNEQLLVILYSKGILSLSDIEEIKEIRQGLSRAIKLYGIIVTRLNEDYQILLDALKETRQTGVLEKLQAIEYSNNTTEGERQPAAELEVATDQREERHRLLQVDVTTTTPNITATDLQGINLYENTTENVRQTTNQQGAHDQGGIYISSNTSEGQRQTSSPPQTNQELDYTVEKICKVIRNHKMTTVVLLVVFVFMGLLFPAAIAILSNRNGSNESLETITTNILLNTSDSGEIEQKIGSNLTSLNVENLVSDEPFYETTLISLLPSSTQEITNSPFPTQVLTPTPPTIQVESSPISTFLPSSFPITLTSIDQVLTISKGKIKELKVVSIRDLDSKFYENLCNPFFHTHLTFDIRDPYEWTDQIISCGDKVYSLEITGFASLSNLYTILNQTKNIRRLYINGNLMCMRHQGTKYEPKDLRLINFKKLKSLTLQNFDHLDSACLDVLQFLTEKVHFSNLISFNVQNSLISKRNQLEYQKLIQKGKMSLKNLRFVELNLQAVLSDIDLDSLKLESFILDVVNLSGPTGFDFIMRLLSIKNVTVDRLSSNVEIPDGKMHKLLAKVKKASVKELEVTIRLKEGRQTLVLKPFAKFRHLKMLNLKLVPRQVVENLTIIGFMYLPPTINTFKISSDFAFKAAGAHNLYCRDYSKSPTTLKLIKCPDCFNGNCQLDI